ncbi:MAG: ATP-binding protein, partial [Chloroflexota bacterium]
MQIRLELLGAPDVWVDDRPYLGFVSVKALAMFCFLAVESGGHARQEVARLFWPDVSRELALRNLRDVLYHLNKDFPDLLCISRRTIELRQEAIAWFDLRLLRQAAAGLPGQTGELDERLLPALARGRFMEGVRVLYAPQFDAWLERKRGELLALAAQFLLRLAERCRQRGDAYAALDALQHMLDLQPWNEEAHRGAMRLYLSLGQRGSAARQFSLLRRALAENRQPPPAVESQELYEQALGRLELPPQALRRSGSLPRALTPFYGRQEELTHLCQLLCSAEFPLVTLAGPGGIGKTRLALEAALELAGGFPDGAWFVSLPDLRPLEPPASPGEALDLAEEALAEAVGAALDIPFRGRRPLREQLVQALAGRNALIVLDDLARLPPGVQLVQRASQAAPNLHWLVTSLKPLGLPGETVLRLDGLALPPDEAAWAALLDSPALRVFDDRARRVFPAFHLTPDDLPAAAGICRCLGGSPLAVELAALLVREHPLPDLLERLQTGLLSTPPDEHSAAPRLTSGLGLVFDEMWQGLRSDEQLALAGLTVFRGSFVRRSAEQVAGISGGQFSILLDRSLLQPLGPGRFCLHPALFQLVSARLPDLPLESEQLRHRHANYYLAELARSEPQLHELPSAAQDLLPDQGNFEAAGRWALESGFFSLLFQATRALSLFYARTGQFASGRNFFHLAQLELQQARLSQPNPPETLTNALAAAQIELSFFLEHLGELEAAMEPPTLALPSISAEVFPGLAAAAHLRLAELHFARGDLERTRAAAETGIRLARLSADAYLVTVGLVALGTANELQQQGEAALACYEEALQITLRDRLKRLSPGVACDLGLLYLRRGQFVQARRAAETGLLAAQELGDRAGRSQAEYLLGLVCLLSGDLPGAEQRLLACLAGLAPQSDNLYRVQAYRAMALLERWRGSALDALASVSRAIRFSQESGLSALLPALRAIQAQCLAAQGDLVSAAGILPPEAQPGAALPGAALAGRGGAPAGPGAPLPDWDGPPAGPEAAPAAPAAGLLPDDDLWLARCAWLDLLLRRAARPADRQAARQAALDWLPQLPGLPVFDALDPGELFWLAARALEDDPQACAQALRMARQWIEPRLAGLAAAERD